MLTGELKKICIEEVSKYVLAYQDRRAKITDEVIEHFMTVRPLEWKGNPNPKKVEVKKEGGEKADAGDGKLSKNAQKRLDKQKEIGLKKAKKAAAASSSSS